MSNARNRQQDSGTPAITAMALKNAAAFLGLQEQRVRNLAKDGTLATETREIPGVEGMSYTVYLMDSLEDYKRRRDAGEIRTSGVRSDGKTFLVKIKPDQIEAATQALQALGIELKDRQATMTEEQRQKRKEYNARRNAQKRAAREAAAAANQPAAEQTEEVAS
jgi:hypothetical protein